MERSDASNLASRPLAGTRRILVVDDEPAVLSAIRRALLDAARPTSRNGCSVDVAATAEDALALAMVHRYDAVITDNEMPGRSGVWLLEKMKERFPGTFRVLHSGSNVNELEAQVVRGVVQRFIPKPAPVGALDALWA
jgi:CheY-like chemotaxis protein